MHSRALLAPFALAGLLLTPVLAGPLAAQGPSIEGVAARLRLSGPAPEPSPRLTPHHALLVPADTSGAIRKDHTVTGLLVGAGVGFIAGWAFYDVICEAVDNNCSDSRLGLVTLGTGAGAALGALIGSVAD